MSDKSSKGNKPLRSTSDKFRDVYNTYVRQDGRVLPIKEKDIHQDEEEINKQIQNDINRNVNEIAEKAVEEKSEHIESTTKITTEALTEKISLLEDKIKALESDRDELREKLLRTTAEMENFRRRTAKERQELIEFANARLLFNMLELFDDIQNALEHAKSSNVNNSILEGIALIHQKTEKLFTDAGVKKMDDPVGKPFDVNFHEALMHIPSEIPEGFVVQVIQNGYLYNERVLRHAKVITSSGMPVNNVNDDDAKSDD
jgi:molecular chaperone GrpE